jgi:hypothetical protein
MKDLSDLVNGFCTKDDSWCAIPYRDSQYVILHQGGQVRVCRSLRTAYNFIQEKSKQCM